MEYRISPNGAWPPPSRIEDALLDADAAAVFDFDSTGELRIATTLELDDLHALLVQAGCALEKHHLRLLPSICCGSCSG